MLALTQLRRLSEGPTPGQVPKALAKRCGGQAASGEQQVVRRHEMFLTCRGEHRGAGRAVGGVADVGQP